MSLLSITIECLYCSALTIAGYLILSSRQCHWEIASTLFVDRLLHGRSRAALRLCCALITTYKYCQARRSGAFPNLSFCAMLSEAPAFMALHSGICHTVSGTRLYSVATRSAAELRSSSPCWVSLKRGKRKTTARSELPEDGSPLPSLQIQNYAQAQGGDALASILERSSSSTDASQKDITPSPQVEGVSDVSHGPSLSIVVVGATGELARSKIFPALFALFHKGCLPKNLHILGYSRSELSTDDLKDIISENLTCRVDTQQDCGETVKQFLSRVFFQSGSYESSDGMSKLNAKMEMLEGNCAGNRIFYLAVPEDVVVNVTLCIGKTAQSRSGWTRVIIAKPFGYDGKSSALQTKGLLAYLNEDQLYRIDHRLGKDLIENLTALRFSNLVFEPLWSRTYIRNVQVVLSEDTGIENKGRYFDKYGIIRDIVQSHILQMIALFAMEPPTSLAGDDIRNEKVKVLRSMRQPTLQDVVLGQYKASIAKDGKSKVPGYLDEPDIDADSITPTFVAAVTYIDNARWDGVPFLIKAGIGLIKHSVEIRIQFRDVPGNLYRERCGRTVLGQATNELILQIQPDESIILKINNKIPGLGLQLDSSNLNLLYRDRNDTDILDSYEHLIMDVITGDNHLFMRSDELKATWDLLDPLLAEMEKNKVAPELYQFGGRGPIGAYYLGAKHGVRWADD